MSLVLWVRWAVHRGASHHSPLADVGELVWAVAVGAHLPACRERGRSRKRSPDAVRRDPKLASHSLALSSVSSVRLIGLKKKVSCHRNQQL